MRDRPILFSAPMIRAILADTKTQTRRVVKSMMDRDIGCPLAPCELAGEINRGEYRNSPYGYPGDRLWVREAFRFAASLDRLSPSDVGEKALDAGYSTPWAPTQFEADGARAGAWIGFDTPPTITAPGKLRPGIHMPRWASRITLDITGVRVERLQQITPADAHAEGIPVRGCLSCGEPEPCGCSFPHSASIDDFRNLWRDINGAGSWEDNPWVWVVEFGRVKRC
ncbi:hypothetical protein CAL26_09130 [Bordetella genomosp. 9]|uniref:Morphogenetic protein n=1 Tax=Bordetella genomosp. 9 TaxID=1416803 RepID=A0A261RH04_9BORD|nr:hypothetical protein [Bordetella genomosp. 9]OZI23593.1 hypothetical protein CAL26_09130 [Bordetella genomosp. 9]